MGVASWRKKKNTHTLNATYSPHWKQLYKKNFQCRKMIHSWAHDIKILTHYKSLKIAVLFEWGELVKFIPAAIWHPHCRELLAVRVPPQTWWSSFAWLLSMFRQAPRRGWHTCRHWTELQIWRWSCHLRFCCQVDESLQ